MKRQLANMRRQFKRLHIIFFVVDIVFIGYDRGNFRPESVSNRIDIIVAIAETASN